MTTASGRLLSEAEAAEFLRVKPSTLSAWRSTKRVAIPYIKIGHSVKYRLSTIEAYLLANTVNGDLNNAAEVAGDC